MVINCLLVGFGGALGAVCRYLFGFVPLKTKNGFPLITLLINISGSLCIGFIMSLGHRKSYIDPKFLLLFKVGFCGGFTTFSTFSLESLTLIQKGAYSIAILYMLLSLLLCIAGVAGGMMAGQYI
jgi:fluoride exporter